MIALWAAVALAAPDRLAWSGPVGGVLEDVAVSPDGAWAATVDVSGPVLWLLDTGSWTTTAVSALCDGAAGVVLTAEGEGTVAWVGCEDGTVDRFDIAADGTVLRTEAAVDLGDGAVLGLEADEEALYAVLDADGGLEVTAVGLDDAATGTGFPVSLIQTGYADLTVTGTTLVVLHGGDDLTRVDTTAGGVANPAEAQVGRDFVDAYPYAGVAVWAADAETGSALRFNLTDNTWQLLLIAVADTVRAVALDDAAGWLALATGEEVLVYPAANGSPAGDAEAVPGVPGLVELAVLDGYLLGVDDDAAFQVLTDRPWVDAAVTPVSGASGTAFTLTFSSDLAGTWEVRVGGDLDGGGTAVDTGAVAAGETVTVDLSDVAFAEGENRVWVRVDGAAGVGRDAVDVLVDNPPGAVTLGAASVTEGDGYLALGFDALEDADVSDYVVYLSTEPFTAAEWPTGGPEWSGEAAVDAPREVNGVSPGSAVSVEFSPLENGTVYYLAVRATDAGGLEGPMSEVVSGTPSPTYSASELAGDPGGYCATTGRAAGLGAALLGGLALVRRRRAAVAALVLVAPLAAQAKEPADEIPRFHVNVRAGPAWLADEHLQDVFGETAPFLRGEYGVTTRLVELGVGTGFLRKKGFLLDASGEPSDEWDKLTVVPLTADLSLRLDFFPEQLVVPYGRVGADYWFWWEKWYVYEGSEADDARRGGKPGWHWAVGGHVLLDPLDKRAASRMRAVSGIDDTFLTVEYRQTTMPSGAKVLELSDKELTFGLKFDF